MDGIGKELIRWLLGGGALALATFLGTTAYQQGQLNIERERYLRDFLGKYVELATKGSLDERIRFVQYWESLDVSDEIGVDLTAYKKALAAEFNEADRFAAHLSDASVPAQTTSKPSTPLVQPPPTTPSEITSPVSPSQPATALTFTAQQAQTHQEAYYASRSQTIAKLIPGASTAPALEREGFEALLDQDIRAARDAFRAAEKAWPEYHNVAEIARALDRLLQPGQPGADGILGPAALAALYNDVLRDYSWGMPNDLKARMQALAKSGS